MIISRPMTHQIVCRHGARFVHTVTAKHTRLRSVPPCMERFCVRAPLLHRPFARRYHDSSDHDGKSNAEQHITGGDAGDAPSTLLGDDETPLPHPDRPRLKADQTDVLVTAGCSGWRLDTFLRFHFPFLPFSRIQENCNNAKVWCAAVRCGGLMCGAVRWASTHLYTCTPGPGL
jgi:hypothetical protein